MSTANDQTTAPALPWRPEVDPQELPVTEVNDLETAEPVELGGGYARGWTPRPLTDVTGSWLRQVTFVPSAQGLLRLQARLDEPAFAGVHGDQHADRPVSPWPVASAMLVIGAVRGPTAMFDQEAVWSRDELARHLGTFGVRTLPSTTVDRGHQWTEPSVIALPGMLERKPVPDWQSRTLGRCRQMGIRTVVRIADGRWEVLSLGDGQSRRFTVVASAECTLTRDDEHRCPMQRTPAAGMYCRMRGGPWTSSSIHAAAGWRDHRDRLVAAVGCDTCEGMRYQLQGRILTSGGPIAIVRAPSPTRWLAPDESTLVVEGGDDDVLA